MKLKACAKCGGPIVGRGLTRLCADCRQSWKWCPRCEDYKSVGEFKMPGGRDTAYCYECIRIYQRNQGKQQHVKDYHYAYHLQRKFGITREEAEGLIAVERCECCGGKKNGERFHVDHDHKTGRVRGVICRRCNYAVAVLEESDLVDAVTRYLSNY